MTAVDVLLAQFDQGYNRKSWHGTNLRGSIRGLTARESAWRPHPARHSIQEIVVHAACTGGTPRAAGSKARSGDPSH